MTAWIYAKLPDLWKSDPWGYKWHARYKQVGFYDLDDQVRTGRPPKVDKAIMRKIRKNACKKLIWTGKGVQDYIFKNTGTKYYITHVGYLLRKWGYTQKVPVGMACKQGICRRDPCVPKRDCRCHKKKTTKKE